MVSPRRTMKDFMTQENLFLEEKSSLERLTNVGKVNAFYIQVKAEYQ